MIRRPKSPSLLSILEQGPTLSHLLLCLFQVQSVPGPSPGQATRVLGKHHCTTTVEDSAWSNRNYVAIFNYLLLTFESIEEECVRFIRNEEIRFSSTVTQQTFTSPSTSSSFPCDWQRRPKTMRLILGHAEFIITLPSSSALSHWNVFFDCFDYQ